MKYSPDTHLVTLQFYLPRGDKEAFQRACFMCDTTMSRELRRFILQFANNPPMLDRNYYFPNPYGQQPVDDE
jgi:hypothetical protein